MDFVELIDKHNQEKEEKMVPRKKLSNEIF